MFNAILHSAPLLFLSQSVWRDEAYSILIAQKPISTYFQLSFEPPLYYLMLHYWIKIVGTSEIAVRSLSLIAFIIAIYTVAIFAKKLYAHSWLSWYAPTIFLLNPMLLYYAFEARSYGWYLAFACISTYTYFEKKWLWYVLSTTLGLYTHAYMTFVFFIQVLHFAITHKIPRVPQLARIFKNAYIQKVGVILLLYSPWIIKMIQDAPRLKQSWYFPVDFQLFKSVLGNIFLGYEGTPWNLWAFTTKVSILLALTSILSMLGKKNRSMTIYFFLLLYVPLITILGISIYKPLFVMRYMIPSTVAEIFLIVAAISHIKDTTIQKIIGASVLCFLVGFTYWFTPYHKKIPMRETLQQINTLQRKRDYILVEDAMSLYESMYYNTSKSQIYWYNPKGDSFPWYIGDYIIHSSQIIKELPQYPYRAFLIHLDGSYEIVYDMPISSKYINLKK